MFYIGAVANLDLIVVLFVKFYFRFRKHFVCVLCITLGR